MKEKKMQLNSKKFINLHDSVMEKDKKTIKADKDILKSKEKIIANMINKDFFYYLKRKEKFNTSLFNIYKISI